jgi:hypothetical protein
VTSKEHRTLFFWKKADVWSLGCLIYEVMSSKIFKLCESAFNANAKNNHQLIEYWIATSDALKHIEVKLKTEYPETMKKISECLKMNANDRYMGWERLVMGLGLGLSNAESRVNESRVNESIRSLHSQIPHVSSDCEVVFPHIGE